MITGFAGPAVTVRALVLVFIVTGETHFALDVSVQEIMSPLAGVAIVIDNWPVLPGIRTPFLYQLITGAEPGFELVSVNVAASPEHNCVLGVLIAAVCVRFGETVTVRELDVIVAGVAQLRLVVSLQLMISPLARPDTTTVVRPVVHGITVPFFSQSITGDAPGFALVRVNVAVWPTQISVLGDEILTLWVRLLLTVI